MKYNILTLAQKRVPAEVLLKSLLDESMTVSLAAGEKLIQDAKNYDLPLADYLRLAIDTNQGQFQGQNLNGFEAACAYLNLPHKNDYDNGVVLQAAAETFATYPGTRAMFPPVMDNVLQWAYRQNQIEDVAPIIAQSRGISGIELITTVVSDANTDYQQTGIISEGSNIPLRAVRTTEKSVKFYKFGGGYEFTYEFERRARLDVLTPYAARIKREAAIGQVAVATSLLINGDGVAPAAPVVTATALVAAMSAPPAGFVPAKMNWEVFLKWMVTQASRGVPIDTIVGNWDMYFEYSRMFATPFAANGPSQTEILAKAGFQTALENPRFDFKANFAVSSTAPAATLIGFVKSETVEELVENGSEIEEATRSIQQQKVTYVSTKNHGYRIIFPDTRSVLSLV